MRKAIIYGIVFIFGFAGLCLGQAKEQNFINITQQDGLPSNETYCVFKDSKGYIWIATDQGVVRHKGTSMQVINNLPDNVVFKIREDKEGRIWFFSRSYALAYFYNEKIYPFKFNDKLKAKLIGVTILIDACIDDQNNIVLNTRPNSNYRVNINSGTITESPYNHEPNVLYRTCVIQVNCINDSFSFAQKLIGNEDMLDKFVIDKIKNKDTTTYTIPCTLQNRFQFYGNSTLKNGDIFLFAGRNLIKILPNGSYAIREFKNEILCSRFDPGNNTLLLGFKNGGLISVSAADIQADIAAGFSFGDLSISCITYDRDNGMWLTTLENGVYYIRNEQVSKLVTGLVYHILPYNKGLLFANSNGISELYNDTVRQVIDKKNEMIHDIKVDTNENIIIAGRFDDVTFPAIILPIKNKLAEKNNSYIVNTSTELITRSGTAYYFRQGEKLQALVSENGTYKPHDIFTTTLATQGITYYDRQKQLLWFETPHGLYAYDYQLASIVTFKSLDTVFKMGISCMREMYNGIYTLGSKSSGITLLQDTAIIKTITQKDGLLSNTIKYLLPDSNRLWVVTPAGISVILFSSYAPLKYTVKNFGANAGLNNLIIYQIARSGNSILAATNKGIYEIGNVEEQLNYMPPIMPLYITTLSTYKGDTSGINDITLPFLHNRLSVSFDALSYSTPKELQYYYRLLDGNDTTWQNLSGTQVILENLAPGQYELQVKASIPSQGRDSAVQKLAVTILKPWWQLNWIRAMAVLLFLAIVYLVYRWRVGIIQQKESEKTLLKTQMAELEQTALRAQMNPHFIFNCLTSIQQLVVTGNREEANEYLVKFSRLIRKTLELSAIPYTSIENEKNYLTEYMELEQLRIPGQFDFYFTIDKQINIFTAELPNMMLQPIIENAIRHGIKHLQGRKGLISITMTLANGCLQCTVTDNGVGRSRGESTGYFTPHKSYGMDIVKKRLAGLPGYNGKNYFIEIVDLFDEADNRPAGTKVILQLPFKK